MQIWPSVQTEKVRSRFRTGHSTIKIGQFASGERFFKESLGQMSIAKEDMKVVGPSKAKLVQHVSVLNIHRSVLLQARSESMLN